MLNQIQVQTRSSELEQVKQDSPALLVVDIGFVGINHECLVFPTFILPGKPLLALSGSLIYVPSCYSSSPCLSRKCPRILPAGYRVYMFMVFISVSFAYIFFLLK